MLRFNKKICWEYTSSILYALCIALVFRSFAFEAYKIPSSSMEPNLLVGDYLFISKYKYGYSKYSMMPGVPGFDDLIEKSVGKLIEKRILFASPARGDIIVFRGPKNDRVSYIKRLIGLPGDTIVMINNDMYVNGQKVEEEKSGSYIFTNDNHPYVLDRYVESLLDTPLHTIVKHPSASTPAFTSTQKFNVPAGHYFFMGDNRDFSHDSRFDDLGMVPVQNILGKAEILFWTSKVLPDLIHLKKDPRWFTWLHP